MKYKMGDIYLSDKVIDWVKNCDADELARVAGEIFGGKCFPVADEKESLQMYEFEPDEYYYGAFKDLTPEK